MQPKIETPGPLLTEHGELTQSGWATELLLRYDRSKVHANALRIKEWDYFEFRNDVFGLTLLAFDVGYQGKIQATFINYQTGERHDAFAVKWFSKGSMNLPPSSKEGDIHIQLKDAEWHCVHHPDRREFTFNFPNYQKGAGFHGHIKLEKPPAIDSIVNVLAFDNPHQFVYAQKINCLPAFGSFTIGDQHYEFTKANPAFGCLDWTRAVFPYRTEWWWASASGLLHGEPFGLNIDYGFGLESSKNMLFYKHQGHHLDKVRYQWNDDHPKDPWQFTSNDNRVNLTLYPFHVSHEDTNFLLLRMQVLKVFGYFEGTVVLNDGTKLTITKEDQIFGHAEHVINRW